MPNPPLRRELAELTIKTIEDCMRDGFRYGGAPSAKEEAARRLKIPAPTISSRLRAAKHTYNLEVDKSVLPTVLPALEGPPDEPIEEPSPFAVPHKSVHPAFTGGAVVELLSRPDNTFLFGAAGDLHAASKYCRWDVREDLYKLFEEEGAQCNFDTGNWIDGESRFNVYDLDVRGLDAQCNMVADQHPRGVKTYAVWGDDHEGWYVQREGIDVGRYMESVMRAKGHDWTNLGFLEAHVVLRNANSGAAVNMAVVHPGGGCFDDKTDILTRDRGWIKFADLTYEDEVATMRKGDHVFEWQRPTHITNEPYQGEMYRFKNRVFDCSVTPDHRFMVKRKAVAYNRKKRLLMPQKSHFRLPAGWHILTAKDISRTYARQRYSFPTTCSDWIGEDPSQIYVTHRQPKKYATATIKHFGALTLNDAIELIGWYVTEGSAGPKSVVISQSKKANPENYKNIRNLLARIGASVYANERQFQVSSVELAEWIVEQCNKGAYHKRLPRWIKNLSRDRLRFLLSVMVRGDGWINGKSFGYRTASYQLMNDVCEIGQKAGYGITTRIDKSGVWTIGLRVVQNEPSLNNRPEIYSYSGNIYCCTVPNGMIYVRANGKAFWSHNSAYALSYSIQKTIESLEGGEKPAVGLYGHYHKLWAGLIRNVWCVQTGCAQDQTPFMRKKRLEAQVGGCLVKLRQDPNTGAIVSMQPEIIRYFNKGFHIGTGRWSRHGPVTPMERE